MAKIAYMFAGQGAQHPGMGQELWEQSPAVKQLFAKADEIRPGTREQCFHGQPEELSRTVNTQPCLYCTDLAAALALREAGLEPQGVAGFSLGEVAALAFSGRLSIEDGFRLVCQRAALMDAAACAHPSGMLAVLKLDHAAVEALCGEFKQVYPVNYNSPGQLVVAGAQEELSEFAARVKQAGGRAVPLAVSGGFHSPFMEQAAQQLAEVLADYSFQQGEMPLYSNVTARPYTQDAAQLLSKQVMSPVRWQETIEQMIADGFDTFIEVGVGKTLANLVKKISPNVTVRVVEDTQSLQDAVAAWKEGSAC